MGKSRYPNVCMRKEGVQRAAKQAIVKAQVLDMRTDVGIDGVESGDDHGGNGPPVRGVSHPAMADLNPTATQGSRKRPQKHEDNTVWPHKMKHAPVKSAEIIDDINA